MAALKLKWKNLDHREMMDGFKGGCSVRFAGGFCVYVERPGYFAGGSPKAKYLRRPWWAVSWWRGNDNEIPGIRGLTDVKFKTRRAAQRAAERIFVPMKVLALRMVYAKAKLEVNV